jgi:voltage-gated potassium channel
MPLKFITSSPSGRPISTERRFRLLLAVLLATVALSTLGYRLIEGGSFLDALYMSVITIATVGFKEVYQLSDAGKIFTMIVIAFSVVTLAYTVGTLGQLLIEGELREILGRRKMEKRIKETKGHFIIVGYGRVGQMVYSEFCRQGVQSVIIENDPLTSPALQKNCPLSIEGSATEDEVLLAAGIQNARGLVSTIPNESDSVYISLTARQLNPKLYIIARADSKAMEKKLLRAGADRVVIPHEIGGKRLALACLRPNVVDFMSMESSGGKLGLSIEEIEVPAESQIAGRSLKESDFRARFGVTVVGIKKQSGDLELDPSGDIIIETGDILVLIGKSDALEKLGSLSKT